MLSNLCCYKNTLPQGAPTSPIISNLIAINIDKRIGDFIQENKIRYTRYADDMTFSGDFNPGMVIQFVQKVLNDENFELNTEKTRARFQHQKQEVTGIVVNNKIQVSRSYRREIRQAIYYIKKFGLSSHLDKTNNNRANYIRHLLGRVNFVLFIDPKDEEFLEYRDLLINYL